jgi:hypothetical protein
MKGGSLPGAATLALSSSLLSRAARRVTLALLGMLLLPGSVYAQASDLANPSSTAREPPRVVHLRSGGFLRGSVMRTEADALIIRRIDGEVVRIARDDVARIAPMDEQPQRRQARVRVRFISNGPNVALDVARGDHRRFDLGGTPTPLFSVGGATRSRLRVTPRSELAADRERVCVAPCTFDLVPGRYRFSLALGNRLSHPSSAFELREDTELRGIYESHRGARRAGLGLILAAPLALVAAFALVFVEPDLGYLSLSIGGGLFLAGGVTGLVLLLREDRTRFETRPLGSGGGSPHGLVLGIRRAL